MPTPNKRTALLSELEATKQALRASEKRMRRATQGIGLLAGALPRLETWALMPLPDEANAARVLTVGECRALVRALRDQDDTAESAEDAAPAGLTPPPAAPVVDGDDTGGEDESSARAEAAAPPSGQPSKSERVTRKAKGIMEKRLRRKSGEGDTLSTALFGGQDLL